MVAASLTVCRLEARIAAGPDARAVLAARSEAEAVLAGPFARALGVAAEGPLARAGEGVAVFDRLAVDVSLVPGEPREAAAARWAAAILSRMAPRLREPELRFADAAEHLAFYLEALLDGRRDGSPALRPFAGFGAMPISIALRAALVTPGAPLREALLRLREGRRAALLDRLGEEDARQVLLALAGESGLVLALSAEELAHASGRRSAAAAAIWLALAAGIEDGGASEPVAAATAEAFGALLRAKAKAAGTDERTTGPSAGFGGGGVAGRLPAALRGALRSRGQPAISKRAEPFRSPVTGFAMLVPDLVELCGDFPRSDEAARLRLDVLTAAADGFADEGDPALRLFVGLDPAARLPAGDRALAVSLGEALALGETATPAMLASVLLRRFAARVRGFETVSEEFLLDNFLVANGTAERLPGVLRVRFAGPPILAALSMAGCDRGRIRLPWGARDVLDYAPEPLL